MCSLSEKGYHWIFFYLHCWRRRMFRLCQAAKKKSRSAFHTDKALNIIIFIQLRILEIFYFFQEICEHRVLSTVRNHYESLHFGIETTSWIWFSRNFGRKVQLMSPEGDFFHPIKLTHSNIWSVDKNWSFCIFVDDIISSRRFFLSYIMAFTRQSVQPKSVQLN